MSAAPTGPQDPAEADHNRGGFAATVMRGARRAGGGYALAQALNLGVYIVLARLLAPADFGQYAAATVLVGFSLLLTESGMLAALVQRGDRLEEAQSTAVAATFAGGLLAALLALAAAPLLGAVFDSSQVTSLAIASSGLALVTVMPIVPHAILQRRFSFLKPVVVDPVEVIAFGAAAIVAAANDMGPWALVIGQYVGIGTSMTLSWILAGWRPRRRDISFAMWRELASYGRHILAATTIIRVGEGVADTVIVGRSLGTAALGQFRYAFRIASMPYYLLLASVGYVLFPALARIQADRQRLEQAFMRSLRWLATLGIPAGLMLIPLGPATAALVFGDVWLPAGYAAVAMCAYAGANAVAAAVAETLKAIGQPAPLTRLYSISSLVTIASMLALAPWGLTAASAGLSIGAAAGMIYALRAAGRATSVPIARMVAEIWPPLAAGLAMVLAILPLDRFVLEPQSHGTVAGLALLGIEGISCVIAYIACLAWLAPETVREGRSLLRRRTGAEFRQ